MRLIDAEALIDKYGEWYTEEGTEVGYIGTIKGIVDSMPTIEPERKTGHWKFDWRHDKATCSECRHTFRCVFDIDNFDNFCRHCGAKMEDNR